MSNKESNVPERTDWNYTQLRDEINTSLTVQDIKQLLMTRGAQKNQLKGRKADLIKLLKSRYPTNVDSSKLKSLINPLSKIALQAELKLWDIDHIWDDRHELIARLINKVNFHIYCIIISITNYFSGVGCKTMDRNRRNNFTKMAIKCIYIQSHTYQ